MISSWSHSKLGDFDKCRFLCYLKHDQRIPEPQRPLPPGKSEHANDRGTRYHENCEFYVRGDDIALFPDIDRTFGPELDLLRVLHKEGMVSLEGEWAVNSDWDVMPWSGEWRVVDTAPPTAKKVAVLPKYGREGDVVKVGKLHYTWAPAWHRCKLDAAVFWSPQEATVIDYKTGRKYGNEVKHAEQMQLYQLNAFMRFPELEVVTTELWYLDQNEVSRQTFTRAQGLRFKSNFDRKGRAITTNTDWKPNPNKFSCKWCEYGPWNGGQCQVGVRDGFRK